VKKTQTAMVDGDWYPCPNKWLHGCCHCALMHRVEMRRRKGKLYMRWEQDKKETRYWRQRMKKKS